MNETPVDGGKKILRCEPSPGRILIELESDLGSSNVSDLVRVVM